MKGSPAKQLVNTELYEELHPSRAGLGITRDTIDTNLFLRVVCLCETGPGKSSCRYKPSKTHLSGTPNVDFIFALYLIAVHCLSDSAH